MSKLTLTATLSATPTGEADPADLAHALRLPLSSALRQVVQGRLGADLTELELTGLHPEAPDLEDAARRELRALFGEAADHAVLTVGLASEHQRYSLALSDVEVYGADGARLAPLYVRMVGRGLGVQTRGAAGPDLLIAEEDQIRLDSEAHYLEDLMAHRRALNHLYGSLRERNEPAELWTALDALAERGAGQTGPLRLDLKDAPAAEPGPTLTELKEQLAQHLWKNEPVIAAGHHAEVVGGLLGTLLELTPAQFAALRAEWAGRR